MDAKEGGARQVAGRRARSNSRSTGSSSSGGGDGASVANLSLGTFQGTPGGLDTAVMHNDKYKHIIVLKSLNGTFETKFLVLPFKPDRLKLGRPVNPMGNNVQPSVKSSKHKLQQQVRPDNGNFDSRVLSRSHASLSCDKSSGKVYVRDLKSSNGTFVNGNRIYEKDVELNIGDVIDLGTDIDGKLEHRKISALVEDISVIPLINETYEDHISSCQQTHEAATPDNEPSQQRKFNVEELVFSTPHQVAEESRTNAQRAAFEAAMFGDVNNVDLEDSILGEETEVLSGIFINDSAGTCPNLINLVKMLTTEVSLEKKEYQRLKAIENFLVNYRLNLPKIKEKMLEKRKEECKKLKDTIKQRITEKEEQAVHEQEILLSGIQNDNANIQQKYQEVEEIRAAQVDKLKKELETLKDFLAKEKNKRNLNASIRNTSRLGEGGKDVMSLRGKNDTQTSAPRSQSIKPTKSIFIVTTAFFLGLIAIASKNTS